MPTITRPDPVKDNTAPSGACTFVRADAVRFAAVGDDKQGFSIVGYSGEIIPDHWWWGNLAFDLKGLKFASKRTPVLDAHSTHRRLGFATKQEIAEKVAFEGPFLSNPQAQECRQDLAEGFPMQASLYCLPTIVEYIKDGATTQVNGKTLKGPGAVFRKATIKEVSMCVFGADSHTSAKAFAAASTDDKVTFSVKEKTMPHETDQTAVVPMTAERFHAEHPTVHDQVFDAGKAEGSQAELNRFAKLQKACGDDTELLVQCFAEGKSRTDALELRNERLAKQLAEASKNTATNTTLAETDPAVTEFAEQVPGKAGNSGDKPASFMDAVAKYKAEHDVTEAEAVNKCVDLYPDLHAQMTEGGD